jgi:hypothetical protein
MIPMLPNPATGGLAYHHPAAMAAAAAAAAGHPGAFPAGLIAPPPTTMIGPNGVQYAYYPYYIPLQHLQHPQTAGLIPMPATAMTGAATNAVTTASANGLQHQRQPSPSSSNNSSSNLLATGGPKVQMAIGMPITPTNSVNGSFVFPDHATAAAKGVPISELPLSMHTPPAQQQQYFHQQPQTLLIHSAPTTNQGMHKQSAPIPTKTQQPKPIQPHPQKQIQHVNLDAPQQQEQQRQLQSHQIQQDSAQNEEQSEPSNDLVTVVPKPNRKKPSAAEKAAAAAEKALAYSLKIENKNPRDVSVAAAAEGNSGNSGRSVRKNRGAASEASVGVGMMTPNCSMDSLGSFAASQSTASFDISEDSSIYPEAASAEAAIAAATASAPSQPTADHQFEFVQSMPTTTSASASSASTPVPAPKTTKAAKQAAAAKAKQKSRPNHKPTVTAALFKWLMEHQTDPYPNDVAKRELAGQTGLTLNQINDWFINARRRYL